MRATTRRAQFGSITLILLILATALAVATPLYAQPGPSGFRGRFAGDGPGAMGHIFQQLSLTDAQRDEIRQITETSRDAGAPLHEQLRAARQALNDAITDEVVNESTIRALSAQIAPLEAEAAVQRAHTHSAVLMVLTPDQRDELETLREEARERFRARVDQRRERHHQPR